MSQITSAIPDFSAGSSKIIYPASKILNSNFPLANSLFLKMVCYEFTSLRVGSSLSNSSASPYDVYSGIGNQIATIFVPAPKQIISNTNITYVDDTTALGSIANFGSTIGIFNILVGLLGFGETGLKKIDQKETLFDSAEKRAYTMNFTLSATNDQDAAQVSKLVNILHALALPEKTSNSGPLAGRPPLWRFGIGQDITGKIDPSWLGQTKPSVLKSISVNTAAGGSPYAINHADGVKPLIVSFSLTFVESQAAYRASNSYNIISRSESIST